MSSSGPSGTALPPRVCDQCGLLAEDTHYFCKGCRNRLPDPGQTARPMPVERPALAPSIPRPMATPSARRGRKQRLGLQLVGSMLLVFLLLSGIVLWGLRYRLDLFRDSPSEVAVDFIGAAITGDCETAVSLAVARDSGPDDLEECRANPLDTGGIELTGVRAASQTKNATVASVQVVVSNSAGVPLTFTVFLAEQDREWRVSGGSVDPPTIQLPVPQVPPAGTQGP